MTKNEEETARILQTVLLLKEGVSEFKIMVDYGLGKELKEAKAIINKIDNK